MRARLMKRSEHKPVAEFDPSPKQVAVDTRLGVGVNSHLSLSFAITR